MLHARLELDVEGEILSKALNPDSLDWCRCFNKDGKFIVEIDTKKIGTLLYTVDDYLINIKVALEILDVMKHAKMKTDKIEK